MNGRLVVLDLNIQGEEVRLLNVYGPNTPPERHEFYKNMVQPFTDTDLDIISGGDCNCALNPNIDRKCPERSDISCNPSRGMQNLVIDRGSEPLHDIISNCNLEDVWRRRNPNKEEFTWEHNSKNQASRIDYWLVSKSLDCYVKNMKTIDMPFTDHKAVLLDINMTDIKRGAGFWKMNNDVIKSDNFKERFLSFWNEWKAT